MMRRRRLLARVATGAVVTMVLAMIVSVQGFFSVAGAAQPVSTNASEEYVLIGSPAEVETIDVTSGAEVGSAVSLGAGNSVTPAAMAAWYSDSSAPNQLLVLENESSKGCYQLFNPLTGSAGTLYCTLPVGVSGVVTNNTYALIVSPSTAAVWVLNILTNTLVGSVSVPLTSGSPMDLSFNPDGEYAYVSQPSTGKVVTLEVSGTSPYFQVLGTYTSVAWSPAFITVSASGTMAYVSNGTHINVTQLSNGDLTGSGQAISLGVSAGISTISGTTLDVQVPGSAKYAQVNTSTYGVSTWSVPVQAGPLVFTAGATGLVIASANSAVLEVDQLLDGNGWITANLDGTAVAIVDGASTPERFEALVPLSNDAEVAMVDVTDDVVDADVSVGAGPDAVAVSPDGNFAYVANSMPGSVSVLQMANLDTSNNVVIATISLPSSPSPDAIAVDPSGDRVLVADSDTGEVSVIDSNPKDGSSYLTVISTIYLDGSGTVNSTMLPAAIAFSPDGTYAYVVDQGTKEVTVLALSSPETYAFSANLTSLGFVGTPAGIAISPNDQTAYVADYTTSGSGYLRYYQIDPQNGTFVNGNAITLSGGAQSIALSPEGQTAYVVVNSSQQGAIVNTSTDQVTGSFNDATGAIALTPDGNTVVADYSGTSLAVSNSQGTTTLSLGSSSDPTGLAISPMFSNPSGSTLVGSEDTSNPVVAASGNVKTIDGVNTATGGYDLSLDDLSLPDVGLGLDLSQSYDSRRASVNGPLGYGWSFSYGMSLSQNPPNDGSISCDITIAQGNGTPAVFLTPPNEINQSPCPTGGYVVPTFEQASLKLVSNCYNGDSCWDMTVRGNEQYLFDQNSGELVFEKDPNGNTVTFSYSGSKLQSVTGASGVRQLSFSWSGNDISQVTDSASRTVSFGYSSGYLTSITVSASSTGDPNSHEWAFSYNSSNLLSDWWSPDNEASYPGNSAEATQISYNSSGQVIQVTDPDWVFNCSWQSSGADCAPTTSFGYPAFDTNSDTGTVLVSDQNQNYDVSSSSYGADGNVTLYRYVDGVLVETVKGYGYELSGTSPYTGYSRATSMSAVVPDPFTWQPADSLDGDAVPTQYTLDSGLTQTTYDGSGNVIETIDPMGQMTTYLYNSFDEVVMKFDPNGNWTYYTYDSHGNELMMIDADLDYTSYAYNSNGTRCAMLNADGYAAGDRLTSCPSSSAPYETVYGYDSEGDLVSTTVYDGTGNTVSNTYVTTDLYNSAGEQCASLTADGYAAGDRLPSSCPSGGAAYESVETAFDAFGNVLSSISPTNASGGTTTTVYDASGNQLSQESPSGTWTTSTYDPDGHLCWSEPLQVSDATCASPPTGTGTETTTFSYDPDGNQLSTVSPDGNTTGPACLYTTSDSYGNLGFELSVTTPTGGTSCGNETTSTTTYTYDADGNQLTSVVSPPPPGQSQDVTTTSAYSPDGELCWSDVAVVSDPTCYSPPTGAGTETTTYSYDQDGNLLQTIPPDGNASGSPSNYATTNTYNAINALLSQTVPPASGSGNGETTTYYYDHDGNTLAVTGPNGNPSTCNPLTTQNCADTTYNLYDEQNRELSSTDPSGIETQFSYDANGSQLTKQVASSTGTYTYNGAGEVIEISYSDGTPTVSYQYNSNGQVCWMYQGVSTNACTSPPSGATTYSYDSNGRLVSTTNAAGATDTYAYDASSNVTCVSYPNSSGNTCSSSGTPTGVVRYSYNQSNQLTSLTDWAGDTLTFTYTANGDVCWVSTYAPGTPMCSSVPSQSGAVTTAYSYDALGNVSSIQTTTGTSPTNLLKLVVGSRDASNNILAETPTVGATVMSTDSYTYNQSEQVSSGPIVGSSGSSTYSYLPTGSMTADTTGFQNAAYAADGELCWTLAGSSSNVCGSPPSGATTYSYNSSGERTAMTPSSGNPASYSWEAESNRLVCVNTDGTSCSTSSPTSTTTVYTYDGNGLRTSSTIGGTTTSYTWGSLGSSPRLFSDGIWDYVYAGGATPIEQIATSGSSPTADLLLSDESSNVRGLVQLSSGTHQDQLVNYTDYDAYGTPITESGGAVETGGLTTPQTSFNANYVGCTPWGFGEGYADATGLVYLINRYYDPHTGQFLSVDPVPTVGVSPYIYAKDNPVTFVDSTGAQSPPVNMQDLTERRCVGDVTFSYELCEFVNYDVGSIPGGDAFLRVNYYTVTFYSENPGANVSIYNGAFYYSYFGRTLNGTIIGVSSCNEQEMAIDAGCWREVVWPVIQLNHGYVVVPNNSNDWIDTSAGGCQSGFGEATIKHGATSWYLNYVQNAPVRLNMETTCQYFNGPPIPGGP